MTPTTLLENAMKNIKPLPVAVGRRVKLRVTEWKDAVMGSYIGPWGDDAFLKMDDGRYVIADWKSLVLEERALARAERPVETKNS